PQDLPSFPTRRSSDLGTMVSQCVDYWKSPPRRRADQVAPPGSARKPTAASRRQSRQQLAQAQRPQSPIWVSPGPDCLIFLRIFLDRKSTRLNSSHVKI